MRKRVQRWVLALAGCGALVVPAAVVLPSTSALAANCAQPAGLRIVTPGGTLGGGNTVTIAPNSKVYPVGIADPGTYIFFWTEPVTIFAFQYPAPPSNGKPNDWYVNPNPAGDNCVVNQPSNSQAPILIGQSGYMMGQYQDPKTGNLITVYVGHVIIT